MYRILGSLVVGIVCLAVAQSNPGAVDDAHAYFSALISRGDCFKAYSFRPQAGHNTKVGSCAATANYASQLEGPKLGGYAQESGTKYVTYDPTGDSNPRRQDAAKVVIPAFAEPNVFLAEAVNATQTTFTVATALMAERGKVFKIGSEYVGIPTTQATNVTFTVIRGLYGSTPASHPAGSPIQRNTNSLINQVRVPVGANGSETAKYLFVWDAYWTDSYIKTGLIEHKTFQFAAVSDKNWFRADAAYAPHDLLSDSQPGWNINTQIALAQGRRLSASVVPPAAVEPTDGRPAWPMVGAAPIIYPNKWTRWFVLVETRAEGVAANFTNVTTLAAPVDAGSNVIRIHCPASRFTEGCGAFTAATSVGGSGWPGRSLRIGSETMTITSGTSSGETRDLTVARGAYGTSAASHTAGDDVQLVNDYISMWFADEDHAPVQMYDRYPVHLFENHSSATARGALSQFWIEFNTSTAEMLPARVEDGFADLVAYVRNLAILKNPPADISPLLLRPMAGVPPAYVPRLPAPSNLRIYK
jgi:hypothetical protein